MKNKCLIIYIYMVGKHHLAAQPHQGPAQHLPRRPALLGLRQRGQQDGQDAAGDAGVPRGGEPAWLAAAGSPAKWWFYQGEMLG